MADKLFGVSLRDQRVKWLLVAGLAAVLLAIVVCGSGDPPGGTSPAATPGVRKRVVPASGKAAGVKTARSRWTGGTVSADELETTLQFNPFAPAHTLQQQLESRETPGSDSAASPTAEQRAENVRALAIRQRLSEFRGQKISVLFRTADGTAAARIGGRVVREGEILDGIRIVSIGTDGVVIEAVTPPQ